MRIGRLSFLVALFLIVFAGTGYTEEIISNEETLIQEKMDQLELDEVSTYWEEIRSEYGGFLPEIHRGSFKELFGQGDSLSLTEWMKNLLAFFFHELISHGRLIGTLILLTVFSMILVNLQQAFEKYNVSKVAYAVTYMVLIIIALNSFYVAMKLAESTVETMSHFMVALIPLLLVLMATVGSVTSVALFHPFVMFMVHTSGVFVQYVILPLLLLSTLLSIVNTMTEHYKVSKLAAFLKNIAIGSLGLMLTVFLGVLSVQGTVAAAADGIAVKTAKFVTGNFIPVVGRMFTDAADTVMGASLLLKNTIGAAGLLVLLLICIFPALKVLAISFIYTIASAVLQPLGGGPVNDCLSVIGKNILYVFAALAVVTLMFFLSVTIIIVSGNLSIMLR